MTATAGVPQGFSTEELARLLTLLEGADTVELKLTVPDGSHRSAVDALEMDPLDANLRQVFFFDTQDLLLNRHGIIVRARRAQGGVDDSVVKLRPVVPNELPAKLRGLPGFGVEVDAMPGGFVCSARLKASLRPGKGPGGRRGRPIGPIVVHQAAASVPGRACSRGRRHRGPVGPRPHPGPQAEVRAPGTTGGGSSPSCGTYPDGSRILELSTKCAPAEAFDVAAKTRVFLHDRGIDLSGEQQTKTKTALEFFSQEPSGG